MNYKGLITVTQMMRATIGGENKEEINEEIKKMNEGNGSTSPQEMREYLLRDPAIGFVTAKKLYLERKEMEENDEDEQEMDFSDDSFDLYDEYARQFGGMLIKLMEEKPDLAESNDWLLTSKKELILEDSMEDWLTVLSAKWAESVARYALSKPYYVRREI